MPTSKVYVINGETAFARTMDNFFVDVYEFSRDTPKRWYVKFRGGEKWFDKGDHNVFFEKNLVVKRLQAIRERKLLSAKRAVESLKAQITIKTLSIPADRVPNPEGPIEL